MTKLLANTCNFLRNELNKLEARLNELSVDHAEAEATINYLKKCLKGAEKSDAAKLPAAVLTTLRNELSKAEERRDIVKAARQELEEAISFLKKTLKGAE